MPARASRSSSDLLRAGRACRSCSTATIDITWGGPMRVMKARDQDPHSPLVCFCEVVARDPFFLVGQERRAPVPADRPARRCASPRSRRCRRRGCACSTTCASTASIPTACARRRPADGATTFARCAAASSTWCSCSSRSSRWRSDRRRRHPLCRERARADRLYGVHRHPRRHAAQSRRLRRHDACHRAACRTGSPSTARRSWPTVTATFYPDVAQDLLASSLARYREAGIWSRTTEDVARGLCAARRQLAVGWIHLPHAGLRRLRRREPVLEIVVNKEL